MPWSPDIFWVSSDEDAAGFARFASDFTRSMPTRYQVLFDARTIRLHAAVAYRRHGQPARAEVWRSLPDGSAAFCIVADDRPGLLSAIAAALSSHRLDVITALVFSREWPGDGCEAVDLVWVKRARPDDKEPIDADEAASVGEVLGAILAGRISVEDIASRTSPTVAETDAGVDVHYGGEDEAGRAVLVVEAADRPGVLLTITFELFKQGAQIVRSLVRTVEGRAFNQFELAEFSGAPLTPERREQIRTAVLAAVALKDG
jgi:[protein-PII] uridylyltransferase